MTLSLLPPELISYLGNFLPNDGINAMIQTQRLFAQILTPHLYNDKIMFKAEREEKNDNDLDPYDLPLECLNCVSRWQSDIILDYFRARQTHVLAHTNENGRSLFHVAAGGGNIKLSGILLSKGLNIDAKDARGTTPLLLAAENKKEEMMVWLLDAGADATAFDSANRTVLLETALFCSGAMVQRVMRAVQKQLRVSQSTAPDIFAPSTGGRILHAAIFNRNELAVRLLLDTGVDISAVDGYGTTPLASAVILCHSKIIHLLLDRGAEVVAYDTSGRSALAWAAEVKCDWSIVQRLFQTALKSGCNVTEGAAVGDGLTLLHRFACAGNLPAVELLINNNADVLARSEQGFTALNLALARYPENPSVYEDVCRILIETIDKVDGGYDHSLPSEISTTGGTSLHLAARYGSQALIRLLISSGADILALDENGESALDIATASRHEAVALLLSHEEKTVRHGVSAPRTPQELEGLGSSV